MAPSHTSTRSKNDRAPGEVLGYAGPGARLHPPPSPSGAARRRPMTVVAGALVLVLFAAAFVLLSRSGGSRGTVLALARPVEAGHVLTSDDLTDVHVSGSVQADTVPGARRGDVVGRTAVIPLKAGSLLAESQLGARAEFPPAGKAVAALSVKSGSVMPTIEPGQRVAVMPGAEATSRPGAQPATTVVGTVVLVRPGAQGTDSLVVSLLVDTAASRALVQLADPHVVVLPATNGDVP